VRETFVRWLSDETTWIGIFENQDLGHHDNGRRIARSFDISTFDAATVGKDRAPDHQSIGLGWRYILVAKTTDLDTALVALEGRPHLAEIRGAHGNAQPEARRR
jgi:hypothetical protein